MDGDWTAKGDTAREMGGPEQAGSLSRRSALGHIGRRAAAVAVGVWVVPEIIVGTPTAAGALSAPPSGGGGGDGGNEGSGGAVTSPGGSSVTGGTGTTAAAQATTGASGSLAFTGADIERDLEIGGGLIVGGWLLQRWSRAARRIEEAGPGTA